MGKWFFYVVLILEFSAISTFAQRCKAFSENSDLVFRNSRSEVLLRLDEGSFIDAKSFKRNYKSRFGSLKFSRSKQRTFNQLPSFEIQQYDNSFFLLGNVTDGKDTLPFEVGIFVNDTFNKSFWISVKITDTLKLLSSVSFTIKNDAQHFYGFGEQFSRFDFAGERLGNFTEENGIGRGDKPVSKLTALLGIKGEESSSYFPLPKFFTENGQAFSIKPTEVFFNFTKAGNITVEAEACRNGKCLFNISSDTATAMFQPVYHHLPDWAYGTVIGLQGGEQKAAQIVDEALAVGNPVTAVWIQDWVGKRKVSMGSRLWWRWEPDAVAYPDLKQWIAKMNARGVKVLGYINPFIIKESRWFAEASAKNYLVKNAKGKDYKLKAGGFDTYLLDLASPAACEWFKQIIKTQLIGNGFSGWMADFAEWMPMDAELHNGLSGMEFHNFYPVAWARINREAAKEAGVDDSLVIFHRSGNDGSNKYVKMLWTGDQTPDFGLNDGFPSAVKAVLTSAASGTLYNHSDIGGYTNIDFGSVHIRRTRELLYRWAEFAAFTPFFRTHEGVKPDKNIQVYSDTLAINFFARMGKLHFALKDYMKASVMDEHGTVQPLIRPFYYQKGFENFPYQYLLGNDLLIAPIVEPNKQSIAVKLPEGEWEYGWNDIEVKWDEALRIATVDVPFGKPAVFYRKGGKLNCCETLVK